MATKGINKVILIGNLGNDPEVRYTAGGTAIANLSIATSESWRDKQTGQQQEKTEWHRVVIFGKLAEIAQQYLRKGSKVYIEGKLQTRKWQDQQGNDRYTTEIAIDGFNGQMQMLDSRQQSQDGMQASHQSASDQQFKDTNLSQSYSAKKSDQPPAGQMPRHETGAANSRYGSSDHHAKDPNSNSQQPVAAGAFDSFDDDVPF